MFERPGVLSVGDQVVFGGTVHTVVAISGTKIRLLSDAGESSVVALPFLLSAEDFELVCPSRFGCSGRLWAGKRRRHAPDFLVRLADGGGDGARFAARADDRRA